MKGEITEKKMDFLKYLETLTLRISQWKSAVSPLRILEHHRKI